MPTSREHRAQRLMHKSQLDDLQMPRFVPKVIIPPQKENDLYPLKWPAYKSSDVQNKVNDVLGPLSLFAPYPREEEPEQDLILERPVTPVNEEIKSQPLSFERLAKYVRRRIAPRDDMPYLSLDDQRDLAAVIMGEANEIWPDIRRQIDDPFLSAEENKELNRRIAVHIVTVCEKLFHHYLHKAQILNERGVFSGPANMSRLKAQLALDADKFLNILTIRRYLVADMRGKVRDEPVELNRLQTSTPRKTERPKLKPLSFTSMIQSSRPKSQLNLQKVQSMEQELREIHEAMPYLDTNKLVDLVADLPERSIQTPSDVLLKRDLKKRLADHKNELEKKRLAEEGKDQHAPPSRISEGESRMSGALIKDLASRGNVNLKRTKSQPVLHMGETLLDELGIDSRVREDKLLNSELEILHHDRLSMAKAKSHVVTKLKLGSDKFLSEDLRQLMMDKDETGVDVNGDDDLPPLLQAITRHARHDNLKKKLERQLKELEEKEKERERSETIEVQLPTHPQPATVNAKVGNKMVVRTSDIRVSERVCLSSITLSRFATVYNDLIEEIDPVTVKSLDKNLFLSDEIREVYREIMKTVPYDHLELDHDEMVVSAPESVNVAGTMASASLAKKVSQRVINPDLYHEKAPPWGHQEMKAWARTPTDPPKNFQGENVFAPVTPNMDKVHEVMHNPTKMSQMMATTANMPSFVVDKMSRNYASWLQWWKSTVTSDDYMKYLSTLETDYMGVVFHFYDSEEGDSDDEDVGVMRGRVSRRTMSSKQTNEQRRLAKKMRERERKLDELRSMKVEYKEGVWNTNCVLMGGLGKDPLLPDEMEDAGRSNKAPETGRSSAKTLQERAMLAAQSRAQPLKRHQHLTVSIRNNNNCGALSRMSKGTYQSEMAVTNEVGDDDQESKEKQPQFRLEAVWNSLQMPDAQRLDMAIKYSCGEFFSKLIEAVERWEQVTELILRREALLVKLEHFERSASDPNRFFAKENGVKRSSVLLLEEARYRTYMYKKIESLDADIKVELDYIQSKFQDRVCFKGRPYSDKMKWDRTEMLHWLTEERKHNALRFESLMRHIPLKPAHLEPIASAAK
ncbi:coiled-coil domain-containing protein 87-like isoform X4 [Littorina saxatilis]|uniref:coiled-coil domain-containing protein 87-like isoform X4 n=1 Tax=Littorina saxatilis TaxID=31220 RepID=UPI0038B5E3D7